MSHIFISFSKDFEFAVKLQKKLEASGFDVWIYLEDIPPTVDWLDEIYKGVEKSDIFLFLLSPDSIQSDTCQKEIDHAVKNGKRIVPLLIRKVDFKVVRKEIAQIQAVSFETANNFEQDFEKLLVNINKDFAWVRFHTKLQEKALDWERTKKDNSRLLRGKEMREVDIQFSKVNDKTDPPPTKLQKLYLSSSQEHEKKLRRRYITIGILTLLVALFSLAWPFISRERAIPGQWVSIPAGDFIMGMDREEATFANLLCVEGAFNPSECLLPDQLLGWSGRQVGTRLDDFAIMDNEVTNAQYQQCVDAGGCKAPEDWLFDTRSINLPATRLNWFQAKAYCNWLGGRLPIENEWEKTARGPNGNIFPWGNAWDPNKSNLEHSGIGTVQSVAQYAESDISYYGIKNMAGNVQEWTISGLSSLANNQPFINNVLSWDDNGEDRLVIVRGGAWVNARSVGLASNREVEGILSQKEEVGFRCVCPTGQTCSSPWTWQWIWFGK